MPHATGMRCFWHFQQNCCDKLCKQTAQKFFIDTVFGRPTSEGLLDAHNKSDLKAGILADTEKARLNGNESPGFWTYVHTHKMMMKKCMIATARIKVGMLNDKLRKPLKSYTYQSESINNKLTHQKEDMAYNDKNKADMSKVQLTKNVWEEVDRLQQGELKLVICGISNEYELAEVVSHLKVPVNEWFNMNEDERNGYVQEFNKMTINDAMKLKDHSSQNLKDLRLT